MSLHMRYMALQRGGPQQRCGLPGPLHLQEEEVSSTWVWQHGHSSAPRVWALPHAVACGCAGAVYAAGSRQEKPPAQVFQQQDFNSRNGLPGCWDGEGSQ